VDKEHKINLIQRGLALKHKLKVHDTLPQADTHEELAMNMWARWELEDELKAIDELIAEARADNVETRKSEIAKNGAKKPKKYD
jgi:hypothetical protein